MIQLIRSSTPVATVDCDPPLTSDSSSCNWMVPYTPSYMDNSEGQYWRIRLTYNDTINNPSKDQTTETSYFDIDPQQSSFSISSPKSSDTLYRGSTYKISWTSVGNISTVSIGLYSSSTLTVDITDSTPNNGSYYWTVPSTLASSNFYEFKITSVIFSKIHKLTSATSSYIDIEDYPVDFTFLQPVSSSEWYLGGTYEIKWTINAGTDVSTVNLDLMYSSTPYTIIHDVANTGSYLYKVPTDIPTSSFYEVRIQTAQFSPIHDSAEKETSYFSIDYAPASFQIINPLSGSEWGFGDSRNIQWITIGNISTVKIELYMSSNLASIIASSAPNTGSFVWTVPTNLQSSTYYKIKLTAVVFSPVHESGTTGQTSYFEISGTGKPDDDAARDVPFSQSCSDLCKSSGLNGDAYCACMRPCGRRCLPGYKDALSGYDPFYDVIKNRIFNENFTGSVYTDDSIVGSTFWQPLGVTVINNNKEVLTSGTKITQTLDDYQQQTTFSLNVPIPIKSTTLTLSTDYQSVKKTYSSSSVYIGFINYELDLYTISQQSLANPQFSPDFLSELTALPTTYDSTKYRQFLDTYGPYYFQSVTLGVRAHIESVIESCVFSSLDEKSINVGLQANGESAIDGTSIQSGSSESHTVKCLQSYSQSTVTLLGGDPTQFACAIGSDGTFKCTGSWSAYSKTRDQNPYRLAYDIDRISNIVPSNFVANLDKAIDEYETEVKDQLTEVVSPPSTKVSCPCAGFHVGVSWIFHFVWIVIFGKLLI